jgi:histidinol-phosphate aminotransferase
MMYEKTTDQGPGLRLHLNENTAGCSSAVLAALRAITGEDIAIYPDSGAATTDVEQWFSVPPGWVQLLNGLDEGLQIVAQAARLRSTVGFESIVVEPCFDMYAACTQAAGGRLIQIPPERDFRFPLEAIVSAISDATRVIYLTDPNNPTGLGIPPGAVEAIAAAAPHAIVLVDEAYADFSGRTLIGPALDRRRNLVVGRTFAKAHGLAALRVGALVAHPDTLAPLRRILPPYSLNICAIRGISAALRDRDFLESCLAATEASRQLIYAFADQHGLKYWPSETNFVLLRIGDLASSVVEALATRGIFIRDRSTQPGCAGCVRITAGVCEHTAACLAELEDILATSDY